MMLLGLAILWKVALGLIAISLGQEQCKAASVFRFANIYGDHMVLQMKPYSSMVWGFGEIGQNVNVKLKNIGYNTQVIKGKLVVKFVRLDYPELRFAVVQQKCFPQCFPSKTTSRK